MKQFQFKQNIPRECKFCHTLSTSTTFHVFVVQTPCNSCWESKNLWSGGLPHTRPSCQMLVQYLITRNTLILFLVIQSTIFISSLWLSNLIIQIWLLHFLTVVTCSWCLSRLCEGISEKKFGTTVIVHMFAKCLSELGPKTEEPGRGGESWKVVSLYLSDFLTWSMTRIHGHWDTVEWPHPPYNIFPGDSSVDPKFEMRPLH